MFRSTKEAADRWPGDTSEKEIRDVLSDELYNCDRCAEGDWCSETEVELHKLKVHKTELLQQIHGNTDIFCKMCYKDFEDKDELLRHIKSDHLLSSEDAIRVERELFICNECEAFFFNKKHLTTHILYCHRKMRGTAKLECPRCHKYIKIHTLWFHFQLHKIQSVANCRICFIKCRNRQHLKEHAKTHMKYLVCDICQYETKKEDLFKQHVVNKHRNSDYKFGFKIEPYFVPRCEEFKLTRMSSFRGLKLMNNVRVCVLCREICVSESEMKQHIKEHTEVPKPETVTYDCECGEKFVNKVLLKHHVFKLKGGHREKNK